MYDNIINTTISKEKIESNTYPQLQNNRDGNIVARPSQMKSLFHSLDIVSNEQRCMINVICGEAGTGKSILCEMYLHKVQEQAPQALIAHVFCNMYSEFSLPYAPFKETLNQLLLPPETNTSVKDKKDKVLNYAIKKALEHAPDVIGAFIPGGSIIAKLGEGLISELGLLDKFKVTADANEQITSLDENKILQQYTDIIKLLSKSQPIIIVLDDFQWADKASINMLYYLSRSLSENAVMITISCRSSELSVIKDGERHPLLTVINELKRNFGSIITNLDAVSIEERKDLLNKILDNEPNQLADSFRKSLFEVTNGNPLFINEMMSSLRENLEIIKVEGNWIESEQINWDQKPARIEGIIEERISKLEDTFVELLSHASVQGNTFIAQILSKTINDNDRNVLMSLSKKLEKEHNLVREIKCFRSGGKIVSEFQFSNYIFQHYFYEELSQSQRMLLHGDIAENLELMFNENLDDVALNIAQHYESSGEYLKSLKYYQLAGNHALKLSCFLDASKLYSKALQLIEECGTDKSTTDELSILINQSICLRNIKGWDHPEVESIYKKAYALAEKQNQLSKIAIVIFGSWSILLMNLELDKAYEFAQKFKLQGQQNNNLVLVDHANVSIANTLFWQGQFHDSLDIIQEFHTTKTEDSPMFTAIAMMFEILNYQKIGDVNQSELIKDKLIQFIASNECPFCKAIAYQAIAWYFYFQSNFELMSYYANLLIEVCKEHSLMGYIGVGYLFAGRALAEDQQYEDALKLINKAYKEYINVSGGKIMNSVYFLLISDVLGMQNIQDKNLELINMSIEISLQTNEKAYLAEQYQRKSELLEVLNHKVEASTFANAAIDEKNSKACIILNINHKLNISKDEK